tara:strand:+ start:292 stop:486 length:195 start_codon:yes stop_codon:yes gene_type:complete
LNESEVNSKTLVIIKNEEIGIEIDITKGEDLHSTKPQKPPDRGRFFERGLRSIIYQQFFGRLSL